MDNLILDGGLDLVRARPATLPGLIRECLNYEIGWRRGYTRIDGFERFDGHISPSTTTGWVFTIEDASITDGPFTPLEDLTWTSPDGRTGPAGVLVKTEVATVITTRFFIFFRSGQRRPEWTDIITGVKSGASIGQGLIDPLGINNFPTYYVTHGPYLDALDELGTTMRDEVLPVPGSGTIVGLHYHEDQTYAIRDVTRVTLTAVGANVLVPGMYVFNANTAYVGEVLSVDSTGLVVDILAVDAQYGFPVSPGDPLDICLSIRFELGTGVIPDFPVGNFVTSGRRGYLVHYEIRDGALDSDNALGVAVFTLVTGNPDDQDATDLCNIGPSELGTPVTGSITTESIMFIDDLSAVFVESVSTQSDVAAMWRSTSDGWEQATTGRQLGFYDGRQDPAGAEVEDQKTLVPGVAEFYQDGGSGREWTTPYTDILVDDASESSSAPGTTFHVANNTDWLEISDFKFALSDTYTVTGIEVNFKGQNTAPLSSTYCSFQAKLLGSTSDLYSVQVHYGGGIPDYSLPAGGNHLPWGEELTPELINSADFGFQFRATNNAPNNYASNVELNYVTATVYFTKPPGERIYLYNGNVDIGWVQIASTVVTEGVWGGPDPDPGYASGYLRVSDWSIVEIPAGIELRTEPNVTPGTPAGVYIATTTGSLSLPTLPGSLLLDENVSKYEMISYNFFASEDRNAIYGVNGAGLAFWYDGETLDFIPTGVDRAKDKPRHIAPHENRLALSYIWGELYLSGTDPLEFGSDVALAASFGFGDKITGLMPAPGKALAVFTESTTNVLIGAPESFGEEALSGTVEQRVINHKVGAIEYTVQNIGNAPIFASFRGIETLETMDQYSDFFTAPLTDNVSSWLLERLQTAAGVEAVNKAVVNSVVVRNKNQFRLFFADGYVLTLTFVGPEKEPQLTIQQYWFQDDRSKYARVYATASGVTTDGRDRAFFSVTDRMGEFGESAIGDNLNYVYELDRGRSFDGDEIDANFALTYYYGRDEQGGPDPTHSKRDNVFHLHGVCAGTADLYMTRTVNYEYINQNRASPRVPVPYESIPFYDSTLPAQEQPRAKYTKGRLTARGFAVSMHVSHKSKLEFPHTIQMVSFVNESQRKQDL